MARCLTPKETHGRGLWYWKMIMRGSQLLSISFGLGIICVGAAETVFEFDWI